MKGKKINQRKTNQPEAKKSTGGKEIKTFRCNLRAGRQKSPRAFVMFDINRLIEAFEHEAFFVGELFAVKG